MEVIYLSLKKSDRIPKKDYSATLTIQKVKLNAVGNGYILSSGFTFLKHE